MEQQSQNGGRDEWKQMSEQMRGAAMEQREHSAKLADQLSRECLQQLQRSVEGVLSIPTAIALGFASTTLYAASILQRGFEAIQITTEALRSGIEQGRGELQRGETEERRLRGGGELRGNAEVRAGADAHA